MAESLCGSLRRTNITVHVAVGPRTREESDVEVVIRIGARDRQCCDLDGSRVDRDSPTPSGRPVFPRTFAIALHALLAADRWAARCGEAGAGCPVRRAWG